MSKVKSGIFGSPAHPKFASTDHEVAAELLEDHLRSLTEKNNENLLKVTINDGQFSEGTSAGELWFSLQGAHIVYVGCSGPSDLTLFLLKKVKNMSWH